MDTLHSSNAHKFRRDTLHSSSGFTLIEELVALSLSSIVLSMGFMLLSYSMKSYYKYKAMCQMQQDARYAMELLYRETRSGKLGPDCIAGPEHNILNIKDASDPYRVVTIKCGMIGGKNVLQRVVYSNNIWVNTRKIIDNAKNIVFDYDCSDNVLNVNLTTQNTGGNINFTISSKIYSMVGE